MGAQDELRQAARVAGSARSLVGIAIAIFLAGGFFTSKIIQPSETAASLTNHIKASDSAHEALRQSDRLLTERSDSLFRRFDRVERIICAIAATDLRTVQECARR